MQCACLKLSLLSKSSTFKILSSNHVRRFNLYTKSVSNLLFKQYYLHPSRNLTTSRTLLSCFNTSLSNAKRNIYFAKRRFEFERHSLFSFQKRLFSLSCKVLRVTQYQSNANQDKTSFVLYFSSLWILMIGLSYAAVPLYRMFCQATGIGGDPTIGHKIGQMETMEPIRERRVTVTFNADHHSSMQWNFKPTQREITVVPGETALAFYTARNPTNKPIVGIATYNVIPFQAGLYFNKIQCFCFEEQWLNPNEEVDMPVFFYIDPDFDDDPQLANTDNIILSYTFFKAEDGQTLPLPGFMKANSIVNLNAAAEKTAA